MGWHGLVFFSYCRYNYILLPSLPLTAEWMFLKVTPREGSQTLLMSPPLALAQHLDGDVGNVDHYHTDLQFLGNALQICLLR